MERFVKIVDFHKYCPTCEFKNRGEDVLPCCECLVISARPFSHKPIEYKEGKNGNRVEISVKSKGQNQK